MAQSALVLVIRATQALARPRGALATALVAAIPAFLGPAGQAAGKGTAPARPSASRPPVILDARCVPASTCNSGPHRVQVGGRLQLTGARLRPGMKVLFPRKKAAGKKAHRSRRVRTVNSRLRAASGRLVVVVPRGAGSGRIVVVAAGRRSRPFGPIYVVRKSRKSKARTPTAPGAGALGSPSGSPFDGAGMWIWYVSQSSGGSPDAIAAQAKSAGIGTVFVKSGDGSTNYWSQFSQSFVSALKSQGLKVCAWQYVYGRFPEAEADLGAKAVQAGADCLVIDAESEYEGRYAEAQRYIRKLRSDVGPNFPVGLASFPYVDYHPTLPYSVFLGPGGAQYNAPQMYWKAIGTSVDTVYSHTWMHNRIYGRALFPLGQTYQSPPAKDIVRFRQLAQAYGLTGLSWWDWQETSPSIWSALGGTPPALSGFTPADAYPALGPGSKGDEVIWLQQHLASAEPSTPINGTFDAATQQALTSFQSSKGLPATGRTDPGTWQAVLALAVTPVDWTAGTGSGSTGGGGSGGGSSGNGGNTGASGTSGPTGP